MRKTLESNCFECNSQELMQDRACKETQAHDRQGDHEGNQEAKHLDLHSSRSHSYTTISAAIDCKIVDLSSVTYNPAIVFKHEFH